MASGLCGGCRKTTRYVAKCRLCNLQLCARCTARARQAGGQCPGCGSRGIRPA